MSTLDDLKKEAFEITQRNLVAKAGNAGQEQLLSQLSPVMKYLKDHFTELANTLNVLGKDILIDFRINDSITLKRLKAQNYKIIYPGADREKDFIFEFENCGEHPTYCLVPIGSAATKFKSMLTDNQIQCKTMPVEGNKSVKFEIKPLVKSRYRFTLDLAKECFGFTISNYSNIWSQTNYLKKNEITQQIMDELTNHVMREENKYNVLVGNTISDEARTKLRKKLQADITAKKAHAAKNEAMTKAQKNSKKEKTILGKIFKKK